MMFTLFNNNTTATTNNSSRNFISEKFLYPLYLKHWDSSYMTYYKYFLFITIMLVSLCGNSLILFTIAVTKRLRNVTNYFLVNMAISDLLVTVTCMPVHLKFWFDHTVLHDPVACKTSPFLEGTSVCCTIFTLIVIALDRYKVILRPFSKRLEKKQCCLIIVAVWFCSMATVSPILFVNRVDVVKRDGFNFTICNEFGWSTTHAQRYTYMYISLTYLIPLIIFCIVYEQIFVKLWFRQIPGINEMPECIQVRLKKTYLCRKRLIKMLLTVVVTFMLCHLPQNITSFLWYSGETIGWTAPPYMSIISFHAEVILYLNASLNPLVYGFLHGRIKIRALGLLRYLLFSCKKTKGTIINNLSPRFTRLTRNTGDEYSPAKLNVYESRDNNMEEITV